MNNPFKISKNFLKVFLFLIAAAGLFCQVSAEEAFTYESLIRTAMENNRDLKSAKEDVNIALASRTSAISSILPKVSLSAGFSRPGDGDESYSYGISASQSIFSGFENIDRIKIQQENLLSAEASYQLALASLIYEIKEKYVNLYRAREFIKLYDEILERRKWQFELVRLKFESGYEHKGSFLNTKASLSQAGADVESSKRDEAIAEKELCISLGYEGWEKLEIKWRATAPDIEKKDPDFRAIASGSPDYRKLQHAKNSAELDAAVSRAVFYPDIGASASWGKSGTQFLPENESWRVGINISLPLFQGFSNLSKQSSAWSSYLKAEMNEKQGYLEKVVELEKKWNSLLDAYDSRSIKKEYLEAAEARAEISQSQYSAGLISFDSWIIIENDLINSKKSYLNAQLDYETAYAAWEREKGGISDAE